MQRTLGRSGIKTGAIGLGCWAIGGPFFMHGKPDGWGGVDDAESIRAIEVAIELGANLIDTADAYGTGHSERVIGRAVANRRPEVAIATKFGFTYDETTKALGEIDISPDYIRRACKASLERLRTSYIDLYQIHPGEMPFDQIERAAETLEKLCEEGSIRFWGWSTDNAAAAARLVNYPHFTAVQQELSVFRDGPGVISLCEAENLASLNRSPLAMGMLTGKFSASTVLSTDDVRGAGHDWVRDFANGRPTAEALAKLDAIRELLQTGGRTLAQGALGWILARSPKTIPIPGFKSEAQVRDNLGALEKGPLPKDVMDEIARVLPDRAQAA
ncbi:aldo/keto reductase [Pelagibacterium limicola]|uniref:aldo/keto reductase n=1 Tax=Pelagibacterium limicola TaxID=2791022 RepID=UPI0018AF89B6|nr:aldo/keto reductase [Pelagibacterium limicola]